MRLLILKDKDITDEELNELQRQFTDLMYEHTGINPVYFVEERDYTNIPTEPDSDGDLKPTKAYLKAMTDGIYARYREFGTDHIIMLVHQDNWIFKGIWGTNWSNIYHSYHFELCRFDKKNMANSLGTLYHEVHHALDALVLTTINFNIRTIPTLSNWDNHVTHGKGKEWEYIRWKENTKSLELIAPHLRQSYEKRKNLHLEQTKGMQRTAISLLQEIILLWRTVYNKKDGVPRK